MNEQKPETANEVTSAQSELNVGLGKTLRHISIPMETFEGEPLEVLKRVSSLRDRVLTFDKDAEHIHIQCGRHYDQWYLFYYSKIGVPGKLNIA